MHITVSLNWMLIGGALALVGAAVLSGAVVYCAIYVLTAIVHGIYRAVRARSTKKGEVTMGDEGLKKGDRVEVTKTQNAGKHGEVTDPGAYITGVRLDSETEPRPFLKHEIKKEGNE